MIKGRHGRIEGFFNRHYVFPLNLCVSGIVARGHAQTTEALPNWERITVAKENLVLQWIGFEMSYAVYS